MLKFIRKFVIKNGLFYYILCLQKTTLFSKIMYTDDLFLREIW